MGQKTATTRERLPFYTQQSLGSIHASRPDSPSVGEAGDAPVMRPPRRRDTAKRRLRYYLPAAQWIPDYDGTLFLGDLLGGLSTACVIIPVALSYASNLAKIPPIYGLYAAAVGPIVYGILGSCAQMNVGPESALSLLIGETIRSQLGRKHSVSESVIITGTVTFLAGALTLLAGVLRLGFLDSVLSRPLLRGFITAVAVVIVFDQSIPALGLSALAEHTGVVHFSPIEKAVFVLRNLSNVHRLTMALSLSSIAILIITRTSKKRLAKRIPWIISIPDILLVVLVTTILTDALDLDLKGVAVLGHVDSRSVAPSWPVKDVTILRQSLSTAILCALLGFFETVVAGKSLGTKFNYHVSPNREMIALGGANIANSLFGALPVFASYSRSKVNVSSGGRTHLSGIICAICVIISLAFLLPLFFYVPKAVLSAIIVCVMFTLIQEAPHDVRFFLQTGGYAELGLMALVFLLTLFISLEFGIGAGVAVSLLRVVKHSQSPRVRILGRVPGTKDFLPVNEHAEDVENVPGCLLVRIPEPLYFANTGQLKDRLDRLEKYGDTKTHPSEPRRRLGEHNQRVVFDCSGVAACDAAAAQILHEICATYVERGVDVWFCGVPGRATLPRTNTTSSTAAAATPAHLQPVVAEDSLSPHSSAANSIINVTPASKAARGRIVWNRFVDAGIVDLVGGTAKFTSTIADAVDRESSPAGPMVGSTA